MYSLVPPQFCYLQYLGMGVGCWYGNKCLRLRNEDRLYAHSDELDYYICCIGILS